MKKTVYITTAIISLVMVSCYAMDQGPIVAEIIDNNAIERVQISWAADVQPYTTGGLTFTYPGDLFSSTIYSTTPLVVVSVQPVTPHPATETFVAEVSNNSSTGATVMVYLVTAGNVSEAPNGSVLVHFLSIGN